MRGSAPRRRRWGGVSQLMHWLCATLILFMLGLGLYMVEWLDDPARKFELYQLHKTTGAFVFLAMAIRTLWRLFTVAPALPETMTKAEQLVSKIVHVLLYGLIFGVLGTGYMMISSSTLPLPIELPAGFHVPNLVAPDNDLSETMKALHHRLAYVLMALVGLHILAALKHRLWDRDDVLQSMLPGRG